MNPFLQKVVAPRGPAPTLIIRLLVGSVFFLEGIQKFLYPENLGTGRFARIGIPAPEIMGPFVGVVEIACGALVLVGLLTRLAALPLVINMLVAIVSTKIPILIGEGFWGFSLRELDRYGFFSMAHEARTDWAMLLGSVFLVVTGSDRFTLDAVIHRNSGSPDRSRP